jgi:hypothetical protein
VSSPHLYSNLEPRSTEEMLQEDGHFLANSDQGFIAKRGVGQGDSSGPLCWIAVFGVLHCWTDANGSVTYPETPLNAETATTPGDSPRPYRMVFVGHANGSRPQKWRRI